MGQYFCKPRYWHEDLLRAFIYAPPEPHVHNCSKGRCDFSGWEDWDCFAFRFKDPEWKKGTALRNELKDFLDGVIESLLRYP